MPRIAFVHLLIYLFTFQGFGQSSIENFEPVVLVSNPGLAPTALLTINSEPVTSAPWEVELWVGSSPVAFSTNVNSLPIPLVVSNIAGRLIYRDLWGSPISVDAALKPKLLTRKTTANGSSLRLKPSSRPGGVRLTAESDWRNSVTRLQWSEDLTVWSDLPIDAASPPPLFQDIAPEKPQRFFRAYIPAPEPPVITLTKTTENRVKLAWKGSGELFHIEFSTNRFGANPPENTSTEIDLASPAVIQDLQPGTTYYFRIRATGPGGTSAWSPIVESSTTTPVSKSYTQRKLLIYGSSIAFGSGDITGQGWAGRLKDSLGTNWLVVNRSIPGSTTGALLASFDRDAAGESWDVVWIGLSLANEGILGPTPALTYDGYVKNQRQLIGLIRQVGAVPIISSTYPHSFYGPTEYSYCQKFNSLLNQWGVAGVDFMSAIDDGNGKWLQGYQTDSGHPNAAGHEAFFQSIPPGFLDSLLVKSQLPTESNPSLFLGNDKTNSTPLIFQPAKKMADFTISFWFKGSNITDKALCGIGPSSSRIHAPGGSLRYTSFAGPEIIVPLETPTAGKWHHIALVHSSRTERTKLYFDGFFVGSAPEKFDFVEQITLGGRADRNPWANAVEVSFWGFTIHRVPLSPATVAVLAAGRPWKLSADLMPPISLLPALSGLSTSVLPSVRGSIWVSPTAWTQDDSRPSPVP